MGPDEYHERYPDREAPGIDNNSYTNVMAVWCIGRAFDVLRHAARRRPRRSCVNGCCSASRSWTAGVTSPARCASASTTESISQFEGYEQLEELDWDAYRARYGNIARLDRILEAEGDHPSRYQLTKQADVLMLLYVLSLDELLELLARLGYECDERLSPAMIEYYEPRTAHGSTLSRVVHAWNEMQLDPERVMGPLRRGTARRRATTYRVGPPKRASISARWPGRST